MYVESFVKSFQIIFHFSSFGKIINGTLIIHNSGYQMSVTGLILNLLNEFNKCILCKTKFVSIILF